MPWRAIRMQAQRNNIDELFRSSLGELEETPVHLNWNRIEQALDEKKQVKTRIAYYRWSAAALLACCLGLAWYNYRLEPESTASTLARTHVPPKKEAQKTVKQAAMPEFTASTVELKRKAKKIIKKPIAKKAAVPVQNESKAIAANTEEIAPILAVYQEPEMPTETALQNTEEETLSAQKNKGNPVPTRRIITVNKVVNNLVAKLDKRKDPFFKIEEKPSGDNETAMNYTLNLGFIKVKRTVN